jgi:RNA polymerase sigma factor (sigma-70 family)
VQRHLETAGWAAKAKPKCSTSGCTKDFKFPNALFWLDVRGGVGVTFTRQMSDAIGENDEISRLVEQYLPLVETIALEYHNIPNASHDELVSEGRVALLSATRSFDPARGNFISYASIAIRNRLNDFYEKQVRRAEAFPMSIDSSPSGDESTQFESKYADTTTDVRLAARRSESTAVLGEAISRLPRRLQIVLKSIQAGRTYEEIGRELGISKQGVYKLAQPALRQVRSFLAERGYGGSVITGAGIDDRVVGLVYICALAPDADETSQTQQSNFPKTDVFSHIEVVDGRIWLRPEGTKSFCGDLSEQEQKLVWATQGVPKPDLFDAKAGGTAWKSKPSWYIVGKQDRTVHPDLEHFFAKRIDATTYELESSHVPMLSKPDLVLDVIRAAAKA